MKKSILLFVVLCSMFLGSCGQDEEVLPKLPIEKSTDGDPIPPLPPEGGGS